VLGPLATYAEPHCYDLCAEHSQRLTVPRGWEIVRLAAPEPGQSGPSGDDLEALANAVREAARQPAPRPGGRSDAAARDDDAPPARRGHLRALPSPDA
jgi:hypothetical protein